MSVMIRLKRVGAKKRPSYKIIVCNKSKARDSRAIEELGSYSPAQNPPIVKINKERAAYWIKVGAQPSDTVRTIIKNS